MRKTLPYPGFLALVAVAVALILASGMPSPARAGTEDVAMFYEELGQYGQWVDYQNYGPVWMPSQVGEDWRPYTDGRWTPTEDGYVFETQEAWGWATYHYGNWMPTESYGWVWVPGRTWYPSTVTWRTSPEEAPVETSYVGWAPIPPPDYVPVQAYAPPGGYYPGAPAADLITSPFFIFASAAQFLLGFGQPYVPAYSYYGCGCLAPPAYMPVFFPQTLIVPNYYTPAYYPAGYMAGGMGAYNWGPRTAYISRVTRINQTVINQTIIRNSTNITRIHNVMPPANVVSKHGYIREIMPPALAQGQRLPRSQPVRDVRLAQANLGKPNIIHAPKQVPQVPVASIPKAPPVSPTGPPRGIAGAGLPSKATHQLTPAMTQKIGALPPKSQITPAAPVKPPVAPAPVTKGPVAPGPGPKVVTPTPGPKVVTPTPGPKVVTPTPGPKVVTPTPGPKVVTPSPGPKAPAMAPPSAPRPPVATTPRPTPAPTPPRAAPPPRPTPPAPAPPRAAPAPAPAPPRAAPAPPRAAPAPAPAPPRAAPAPAPRPAPAPAPPRAAPAPAPRPAPAPARPASPPPSKPAPKPGEKKAPQ